MDDKMIADFVRLQDRKRELEKELKGVKEDIEMVQSILLSQFEKAGVDSVRAGGFTIYLERTLWAGAVDGDNEALMKALKRAKLGVYVKTSVNTQSLSAYARELDRNGKKPPPSLRPHLKISEVFKVKARKAAG